MLFCNAGHGILHTPIDPQDLFNRSCFIKSRQGSQDILQLFALGVEEMTQAKFLGGDGGDDLIEAFLPGQGGINLGKRGL